jgi:hypothetical protein
MSVTTMGAIAMLTQVGLLLECYYFLAGTVERN